MRTTPLSADPSTTVNSKGEEVTHPLNVESSMIGAAHTKLLASLHLPDEEDIRPPAARWRTRPLPATAGPPRRVN